jgi:hypothetical protein
MPVPQKLMKEEGRRKKEEKATMPMPDAFRPHSHNR